MKARISGIGYVSAAGFGAGLSRDGEILIPGSVRLPERKEIFAGADRRYGRLDRFSRLGLSALALCLRDAAMEEWQEKRDIGIIAASRYGCVDTDCAYLDTMLPEGGRFASPNLFAYTLPNCFLGEAALRFGLRGATMVLNRHDPTGLAPLEYALEELHWGGHQGMLAGLCDLEPPPEFGGDPYAYGSVFLLLEAAGTEAEEQTGDHTYAQIECSDTGLTLDAEPLADLTTLLKICARNAHNG